MKQIIFATRNSKKLEEVRAILGNQYNIISLDDINFGDEIPEPFDTIRENAIHKSNYFFEKTNLPCIAEDSGLSVESLDGKPAAYSARYAGEERDDVKNYQKVLEELKGITNRSAKFISVFSYFDGKRIEVFEGEMRGDIIEEARGHNGFGYDPIFMTEGLDKTNAELTPKEKNAISHRRNALDGLVNFLKSNAS